MILGSKCLAPARELIFKPSAKIIKQITNEAKPLNWNERSAMCEPDEPIQLLTWSSVETVLKEGSSELKLSKEREKTKERISKKMPQRRERRRIAIRENLVLGILII